MKENSRNYFLVVSDDKITGSGYDNQMKKLLGESLSWSPIGELGNPIKASIPPLSTPPTRTTHCSIQKQVENTGIIGASNYLFPVVVQAQEDNDSRKF